MSFSVHIDNKRKDIFTLGMSPTQGLDDTTLTADAQYSVNFSRSNRKFFFSLHYNGSNSFLFVNATEMYQFKPKDYEIKISLVFRKYYRRLFRQLHKKRIKWVCVQFFC